MLLLMMHLSLLLKQQMSDLLTQQQIPSLMTRQMSRLQTDHIHQRPEAATVRRRSPGCFEATTYYRTWIFLALGPVFSACLFSAQVFTSCMRARHNTILARPLAKTTKQGVPPSTRAMCTRVKTMHIRGTNYRYPSRM